MIPYEGCTFTGPYLEKDNYYRICLQWPDGSRSMLAYHRYLLEVHLGEYINSKDQVHHIDGNPMNNEISNLTVLSTKEHGETRRLEPGIKEFICPYCGKVFSLEGDRLAQLRRNRRANPGCRGPFCSRSCVTSYRNYVPPEMFKCGWCGVDFEVKGQQLSNCKQRKKAYPNWSGPYCSKYCLGVARRNHAF